MDKINTVQEAIELFKSEVNVYVQTLMVLEPFVIVNSIDKIESYYNRNICLYKK
jgi:hypothetical protein